MNQAPVAIRSTASHWSACRIARSDVNVSAPSICANADVYVCCARWCRREDPIVDILIAQHVFAIARYAESLVAIVNHRTWSPSFEETTASSRTHVSAAVQVSCSDIVTILSPHG